MTLVEVTQILVVEVGLLEMILGTLRQAGFLGKFEIGTNNGAKLQALTGEVRLCKILGFQHIIIETISELVVG